MKASEGQEKAGGGPHHVRHGRLFFVDRLPVDLCRRDHTELAHLILMQPVDRCTKHLREKASEGQRRPEKLGDGSRPIGSKQAPRSYVLQWQHIAHSAPGGVSRRRRPARHSGRARVLVRGRAHTATPGSYQARSSYQGTNSRPHTWGKAGVEGQRRPEKEGEGR